MSDHVLARSAALNLQDGFLTIDGVRLPWWLANVEPEVLADTETGVVEVRVSFLIEGVVALVNPDGARRYVDPKLGDVTDWAKAYVRDQLQAAYPDLRLP